MPWRCSQRPCSRGEREWATGQPKMPASRAWPVRIDMGHGMRVGAAAVNGFRPAARLGRPGTGLRNSGARSTAIRYFRFVPVEPSAGIGGWTRMDDPTDHGAMPALAQAVWEVPGRLAPCLGGSGYGLPPMPALAWWSLDGEAPGPQGLVLQAGPDRHGNWLGIPAGAGFPHGFRVTIHGPQRDNLLVIARPE